MPQKQRTKATDQLIRKSAQDIIDRFFDDLQSVDEMDADVAKIIKRLWAGKNLGRDELLAALEKARSVGGADGQEED